ncbi:WhiB family transcriptional regulator [Streptacidiphilus melanogenes]|uniref:WhiB family transcriptional regulator n=1 Tax=Streptacidiphilus melanogenes TaxID=411235 RepID=UPI00157A60AB|nr:WhiB family transcriptional regulator [Streptacidiphilus melanogenes]
MDGAAGHVAIALLRAAPGRQATSRPVNAKETPLHDRSHRPSALPRTPARPIVEPDHPLPRFVGTEPCRTRPDDYFPTHYNHDRSEVRAAVLACRVCPQQNPCLAWALANPHLAPTGIWGATTPAERTALRRLINTGASSPP